jgi:hypothetical protein
VAPVKAFMVIAIWVSFCIRLGPSAFNCTPDGTRQVAVESECHKLASHVVIPARAESDEYSISKFKPDKVMLAAPVVARLVFSLDNVPVTSWVSYEIVCVRVPTRRPVVRISDRRKPLPFGALHLVIVSLIHWVVTPAEILILLRGQ